MSDPKQHRHGGYTDAFTDKDEQLLEQIWQNQQIIIFGNQLINDAQRGVRIRRWGTLPEPEAGI